MKCVEIFMNICIHTCMCMHKTNENTDFYVYKCLVLSQNASRLNLQERERCNILSI